MKPSLAADAIEACILVQQPVFFWGDAGLGKSSIVRQVTDRLKIQFLDVRAGQLDPVDTRGVPFVSNGQTEWAIPSFLPRSGEGVLFLDELNRAPLAVQNALFQLILDRRLGDYQLPPGWAVIAAGNFETDAGVTKMSAALRNRFVHLELEVDHDDWSKWALQNGIPVEIVAFVRFRPELLHRFDKTSKAFPSPRSWEFVAKMLGKAPKAIEEQLIKGAVGEAAALEFCAFLRIFRSLPNPDGVLMNPDTAALPSQPDVMLALCGALARKATPVNFGRVATYADRLPEEFGVFLIRSATRRDSSLESDPAFNDYCIRHSAAMN